MEHRARKGRKEYRDLSVLQGRQERMEQWVQLARRDLSA